MKTSAVHHSTPTNARGGKEDSGRYTSARRNFVVFAANMGWQLAVVVLLPVIGGAQLDKHLGDGGHLWLFVGLGVALVASTAVVWRTVQLANRLPVPKLTAAEKRKIQKSFEEEDDDE